jgi:DNA-binding NarL/FixJ family response regulator
LLKKDTDTELFTAIETIRHGEKYQSPSFTREMADRPLHIYSAKENKVPRELLTVREEEVLKLIAEGNSSKEIGGLLSISTRTVEHHRANIMKKLKINNLADLIKYAIRKGHTVISL